MFVLLVVYAGRIGPVAADALLIVVLVQACRVDMAVPRHPAAVATAIVLGMTAVQLTAEVLDGNQDAARMVTNLGAIYFAGFAFGVYALLRRWEQRSGRAMVWSRMRDRLGRFTPVVTIIAGVFALQVVLGLSVDASLPAFARPILVERTAIIAPTLTFLLPVLTSAPDGSVAGRWSRPLLVIWSLSLVVFAFEGRAVALGVGVGLIVMYLRPARLARVGYFLAVLLALLWVTGVSIEVGRREVSFDFALQSAASLVNAEDDSVTDLSEQTLSRTKEWRTEWWSQIVDDIREEPLVLAGHGWSVNLGDKYGINEERIRNGGALADFPHNLFLTLAALGGVMLAAAFTAVPLLTLARRPQGVHAADTAIVAAAKAALVAALVVSITGVLVEGSQGGSLFWILIGFLWWATAPPMEPTPPDGDGPARFAT